MLLGVASFIYHAGQILNKSAVFLVICKTYNLFPKHMLSLLPATPFVQVCEVSVPQRSSTHGAIPTGSRLDFSSGAAHLLPLSFSLEDDHVRSQSAIGGL